MSYFNKSYLRVYVGTKASQTGSAAQAEIDNGFLNQTGINTYDLQNQAAPYGLGVGTFGLFDSNYNSLSATDVQNLAAGSKLILGAASIKTRDAQGIHQGYAISNKTEKISPKNVLRFAHVEPCASSNAIVHVGNTAYTTSGSVTAVSIVSGGSGHSVGDVLINIPNGLALRVETETSGTVTSVSIYDAGFGYSAGDVITTWNSPGGGTGLEVTVDSVDAIGGCEKEFFCENTYTLRLNVLGDPALRLANHELFRDFDAYGGCCAVDSDGKPIKAAIDSTVIMIQWADAIVNDPIMKWFVSPIVYTETGNPLFKDAQSAIDAGYTAADVWSEYVSTGHTPNATAGIRLEGAYTSTEFDNCSFKPTDFFDKYPVKVIPSVVYRGEEGGVCQFNGLCVTDECTPMTGYGYGTDVLNELILSERYSQNDYEYEPRMREITQGDSVFVINRNQMYFNYFLTYFIPRHENNNGQADDFTYTAIIPTQGRSSSFEAAITSWLTKVDNSDVIEGVGCVRCVASVI